MGIRKIEVVKWAKYNPRTDRKYHSWFRVENKIADDPKLFGLSAAQKFAVICIFGQIGEAQGKPIDLHVEWFADKLKLSPDEVNQTIDHLEQVGITSALGNQLVTNPTPPGNQLESTGSATNTNTSKIFLAKNIAPNIKIKPSTKIAQPSAFAEFYSGYPRKIKKSDANKIFDREIKSAPLAQILLARDRYLKDCELNGITGKFIQHPSTFLKSWKDWLDPSAGTTISKLEPKPNPNWSEMATRAWYLLQGEIAADATLSELVDKIGIDQLVQFHRDDFRQGGRVALLLKETSEAS